MSSQSGSKPRKRTIKSSLPETDPDATPKQKSHKPEESAPIVMPGFEAIEAVNGLYQKLKASQNLVNDLQRENRCLLESTKTNEQKVHKLEEELRSANHRLDEVLREQQREKSSMLEEKLNSVVASIRYFKDAAHGIMPLLDVITEAADIEYDGATESLYQILKTHGQDDTG